MFIICACLEKLMGCVIKIDGDGCVCMWSGVQSPVPRLPDDDTIAREDRGQVGQVQTWTAI